MDAEEFPEYAWNDDMSRAEQVWECMAASQYVMAASLCDEIFATQERALSVEPVPDDPLRYIPLADMTANLFNGRMLALLSRWEDYTWLEVTKNMLAREIKWRLSDEDVPKQRERLQLLHYLLTGTIKGPRREALPILEWRHRAALRVKPSGLVPHMTAT